MFAMFIESCNNWR